MLVETRSDMHDTVRIEKGRPMTTITDETEDGTTSGAPAPARRARIGGR